MGNPLDAGFWAAVVDPNVYMQSVKLMIEDPDTDIVIIDAEFPKAPHEPRERNIRLINDLAARLQPVVYASAWLVGVNELTAAAQVSTQRLLHAGTIARSAPSSSDRLPEAAKNIPT